MEFRNLLAQWGICLGRECPELVPAGSPNRTICRHVVEDTDGILFIAEGFELRKKHKQIRQNELLEFLQSNHLPGVVPFLRCADNAHGVNAGGCFWQLRRWVAGDALPRESLGDEVRYAGIWGEFLLKLAEKSSALPHNMILPNERFFFADYMGKLRDFSRRKMPEFSAEINLIEKALQSFFHAENSLPCQFAHGDFHPGNILVSSGQLTAVIDWEFAGMKCAGYDLALLLGCLGRDNPAWLDGKVTRQMQQQLYQAGYMPDAAWERLVELMAAIRLGWLGEWIDLGDKALAAGELAYIRMLLNI